MPYISFMELWTCLDARTYFCAISLSLSGSHLICFPVSWYWIDISSSELRQNFSEFPTEQRNTSHQLCLLH